MLNKSIVLFPHIKYAHKYRRNECGNVNTCTSNRNLTPTMKLARKKLYKQRLIGGQNQSQNMGELKSKFKLVKPERICIRSII